MKCTDIAQAALIFAGVDADQEMYEDDPSDCWLSGCGLEPSSFTDGELVTLTRLGWSWQGPLPKEPVETRWDDLRGFWKAARKP